MIKYSKCLDFTKLNTVKSTLSLIPTPKMHPLSSDTLIPFSYHFLQQLCKCFLLSVSPVLSWLPPPFELIQDVSFPWSFWPWGRARSYTVPGSVNKVVEDTVMLFPSLSVSDCHAAFTEFVDRDQQEMKRDSQHCFRKLQRQWNTCLKQGVYWGGLMQCGFFSVIFF